MARVITVYNGVSCWVDVAQVKSLTNVDVDPNDMSVAQGMVTVITGVDPAELPERLRSGDRRRLEDMLCYQAPWVRGRVDLFQETDVSQVSQDGISTTYAHRHATKLAPLANICFLSLSWNRGGVRQGPKRSSKYANIQDAEAAVLRGDAEDCSGHGGVVRDFS